MAVYRKKLVDKDGNTIIPAVGDIYGAVYTATLSSATAGGRADYDFTPDTPVENNKVYAVQFPAPTVNNATIILGDGVSSGSILVPPVSATDSPNYELLNTDMINDTEPLLLMYNGVQWVCLNQKKKVATADLENNSVTSAKVNWATFIKQAEMPATSSTSISSAWAETNLGSALTVSGLDTSATYSVFATATFAEASRAAEFRLKATGANTVQCRSYAPGTLSAVPYQLLGLRPNASGQITLQRVYSGPVGDARCGLCYITILRTA